MSTDFKVGDRVELAGVQGTIRDTISESVSVRWDNGYINFFVPGEGSLLSKLKKIEPPFEPVRGRLYARAGVDPAAALYFRTCDGWLGLYRSGACHRLSADFHEYCSFTEVTFAKS